ncbi:cell wall protein DAN4-like [Hyalella azteca]|uniref:Cell wall protein DAN4-like n=1 Tax=Hyalella azteca TaxID=294128 RepID=A0A8B7N3B6_HYAAZ|nr:cell wall protein DAN4-like [Hyalella azteca]
MAAVTSDGDGIPCIPYQRGHNSEGEGVLLAPSTTITPTKSLLSSLTVGGGGGTKTLLPHLHLSSSTITSTSSTTTTTLTTSSSTSSSGTNSSTTTTTTTNTAVRVGGGRPRYAGPRNCPHCGKRYSTIAALKYHVGLVHSVSDQVPCFYCPNWFDIRTDLKKHLELAHNEHS